uniref:Reverse transcriptase domain-containing protein n=1 Tax=Tanacetum cinerariifolium TaxID=118510 RepID=A0A6L2MPL9_TANCI|nr:reverse transcriptase domain-containing protein [Tanacetum cinerariifolium]
MQLLQAVKLVVVLIPSSIVQPPLVTLRTYMLREPAKHNLFVYFWCMSTHSSARNLFPPLDNPKLTIQRRSHTDPILLNNSKMAAEGNSDIPVPDLWTMEELCQPSLNGWGGPIAPIAIRATNFGLKNDMIQQVQNSCQLHGLPGDDANEHLDKFLHMAKMFLGKFFPPSMVTKLINEITNFCQRPDKSLFEAWERYKLSTNRCPNHNMLPVTQIDTFYNGLTLRHHDTINAAAGGTFMKRRPKECYDLIENMTAHHNDWDTSAQRSKSSSSITSSFDAEIAALKAEMAKINKNLIKVLQVNQQVKAVTLNCKTCGGPHSLSDCPATVGQTQNVYAAGAYQGIKETIILKGTTKEETSSSKELTKIPQPQIVTTNEFTNFMKANDSILRNMQTNMNSLTNSNLELKNMFGQLMKMNTALSSSLGTLPGNTITNTKEELKGITIRSGTAYPRPTIPTTSSSPVVERETEETKDTVHPTNNGRMAECLDPPDLGASINLMPFFVWNKLYLPDLSPTCMTLELADHSISRPVGVAEDVFVKVRIFHFPADFVVIDFDADPRVPLILERSFLKTGRALIDVFEGKLTFRVGKEAITFNLDQNSRYSANYNDMTESRIDVIDMACEEYSQEVLSFSDVIASGNPTPYYDPIISTTSLTLTPFGNSDFLLEEVDAFLAIEDDPTLPKVDQSYVDTKGDILLVEAFLNDDPSLPPPNQRNYLPLVCKELEICQAKTDKSSINEPQRLYSKTYLPILNTHSWKVTISYQSLFRKI